MEAEPLKLHFRIRPGIFHDLSSTKLLVAAFLLAFTVRFIPEIFFPVPVGFDTAIYIAGAKYNPIPKFEFRLFEKFLLPFVHHALGIDLLIFMKVYPPFIHALIVTLLMYYAMKVLRWKGMKLVVLLLLLSLSPSILRSSWDTHGQSLATLLLVALILIIRQELTLAKFLLVLPISALIVLSHQLVSVVAISILLSELIKWAHIKRFLTILILFITAVLSVIYLSPVLTPANLYSLFSTILYGDSPLKFSPQTTLQQGFIAVWYLLPCAILGFFRERVLSVWAFTTAAVYSASFAVPNNFPIIPGRWMVYSAYPLAFFAANSIGRKEILSKSVTLIFVTLTLATGIGMVLPSGSPISRIMHEHYREIPFTLASSTAKQEHLIAVIKFTRYLNEVDKTGCLLTHHPWFYWWSWFFYNGKTLYNGPLETDERSLKTFAENSQSCERLYIIWFRDLGWAQELMRTGEISLYMYTQSSRELDHSKT